jgi:methyl-accepting chemotaxis protein
MAQLMGKSGGDVALMLSQALARTALFTIYPGIGETITKLNMTLGQIKEKIEQKFGLSDKLSAGITDVTASATASATASLDKATNAANKAAENTLNNAEEAANKAEEAAKASAATGKGGSPSKKINKTKVKRRIHNSIRKFYKTNNLKTLKREIQRMKKRFTRGNK